MDKPKLYLVPAPAAAPVSEKNVLRFRFWRRGAAWQGVRQCDPAAMLRLVRRTPEPPAR